MAATHVLLPSEADLLIKSIDISSLDRISDKSWWRRHDTLEKLNIQSVMNATSSSCFITEYILTHGKVGSLIKELLVSELWTERIFPHISIMLSKDQSTLSIYMTLFHEATTAGLIESIFYYKEVCEEAGDFLLDLIDYINRKLTSIILRNESKKNGKKDQEISDIEKQNEDIQFTVSMKSISILKYVADAIDVIPLSAVTRILETHDIPCLLSQLLDIAPWKRKTQDGTLQIFTDNKWVSVAKDETHLLPKIEGQVWLALYQLLLHPESQRKYDFNNYRKTQLLKLRRYMHEMLLDQLPYLGELQRFLENLSVMEPPHIKQEIIIEQLPEIRSGLEKLYNNKWKSIAVNQTKEYFTLNESQMKEQAHRLAATYNLDVLETLINEAPLCAGCRSEATKRCSRCQNEWYCSRPCQVKHWSKHKELCNILAKKD